MSDPSQLDVVIFCRYNLVLAQIACLRPDVDENRLVRALDEVDRFISDKAKRSTNRMIKKVTIGSTHPKRGLFSISGWPSINVDRGFEFIEVSFVGLAAGAGVFPYVRAKVKAHPDLLAAKPNRQSLLETAIFPMKHAYPAKGEIGYIMVPRLEESRNQRLEIIQFLLDTATVRFGTSIGKALLSAVTRARTECEEGRDLEDEGFCE